MLGLLSDAACSISSKQSMVASATCHLASTPPFCLLYRACCCIPMSRHSGYRCANTCIQEHAHIPSNNRAHGCQPTAGGTHLASEAGAKSYRRRLQQALVALPCCCCCCCGGLARQRCSCQLACRRRPLHILQQQQHGSRQRRNSSSVMHTAQQRMLHTHTKYKQALAGMP